LGITFGVVLGVSVVMLLVTQTLNLAALSLFIFIGAAVISSAVWDTASVNICGLKVCKGVPDQDAGIIRRFNQASALKTPAQSGERLERVPEGIKEISRGRLFSPHPAHSKVVIID
jgi:hypothetical protein